MFFFIVHNCTECHGSCFLIPGDDRMTSLKVAHLQKTHVEYFSQSENVHCRWHGILNQQHDSTSYAHLLCCRLHSSWILVCKSPVRTGITSYPFFSHHILLTVHKITNVLCNQTVLLQIELSDVYLFSVTFTCAELILRGLQWFLRQS